MSHGHTHTHTGTQLLGPGPRVEMWEGGLQSARGRPHEGTLKAGVARGTDVGTDSIRVQMGLGGECLAQLWATQHRQEAVGGRCGDCVGTGSSTCGWHGAAWEVHSGPQCCNWDSANPCFRSDCATAFRRTSRKFEITLFKEGHGRGDGI